MKQPTRKYTSEEKQQLVQNLDIEVEHRVRQLEEWLAVALENFRLHQEGLISRIPKLVRAVTMGEFADKYNGDIQACLRGLQSERMGGTEFSIDRDTRKRKWAAAQEEAEASGSGQAQGHEGDQAKAAKNARMMAATPKKTTKASSTAAANRMQSTSRATTTRQPISKPSPGPQKANKAPSFVPVRTTSPVKQSNPPTHQRPRLPSSATFNPTMLPPKAPTYPTLRAPRRDESMLSVNGSPLANPYALGLGWFAGEDVEEEETHLQEKGKEKRKENQASKPLRRVNSIVIRCDPSSSSGQPQPHTNGTSSQTHTYTNPQAKNSVPHSRSNSRTQVLSSDSAESQAPHHAPVPLVSVPSGSSSALVSIPIKDGHLLEFDPLNTSPRSLDKLVGITDSAKKQAKEEMTRLVREAVRKWVLD